METGVEGLDGLIIADKDVSQSHPVNGLENEQGIFLEYGMLFAPTLSKVNKDSILDCLLEDGVIGPNDFEGMVEDNSDRMMLKFLFRILKRPDGDYHFIRTLQKCREREALQCLDVSIEDDKQTIKRKLRRLNEKPMNYDEMDSIDRIKMANKERFHTSPRSVDSDLQVDKADMGISHNEKPMNYDEMDSIDRIKMAYKERFHTSPRSVDSDLQVDKADMGISHNERQMVQESLVLDLRSDVSTCQPQSTITSMNRACSSTITSTNRACSGSYQIKDDFFLLDDDELAELEQQKSKKRPIIEEKVPIFRKLRICKKDESDDSLSLLRKVQKCFEPMKDDLENGTLRKDIVECGDGSIVASFKDDRSALFAMDCFEETFDIGIVEEIVLKHPAKGDILWKLVSRPETEFKLRSYQKELAECALTGQNCIIVAPTGSGKTHVAIYIIREHLKRDKDSKVIFVVPTVALVEQQKKQIEKFTEGLGIKVLGLSGASDLSLEQLVDSSDVFVLTPQILANQTDDPDFLQKLSLILFDECHHTNKDHPYNLIMSRYIRIRHERRKVPLPQIVGLTASIGVGKSKNMVEAKKHVEGICANLDCTWICTVTINIKELQGYVNKPKEERKEVEGRKQDPFNDEVNRIMEVIEKRMRESPERVHAEKEIRYFDRDIKPPSERGCDPYTQWLSRIRKIVCTIHRQDTRSFFITCVDFLVMYNNALMINADCRTEDAVKYIESKVGAPFTPLPMTDGLNEEFVKQWTEKRSQMRQIINDPANKNPKLEQIKETILDYYKKDKDSRCIIFCKTREMTTALVNWMLETPELRWLNPTKLVGTNAPSNREGMTSVQQNDVLKYFKDGNHKVIIATSVAEEGLDVEKCNIVIRYEHVTNSIARVQTRGRARQENAMYVLMAEKGKGAAERESTNAIREDMMKVAIKGFQELPIEERKNRILQLQTEAQVERMLAEDGKRISEDARRQRQTNEEYEIRCLKCDNFASLSSDVRKIEGSHHVITDPLVKNRIKIRPHPDPVTVSAEFEKTGKIYCSECKSDWGMMAIYKSVAFPVIKISSFIVKNGLTQSTYGRWKSVPFYVAPLDINDLRKAASLQTFPVLREDDWNTLDLGM